MKKREDMRDTGTEGMGIREQTEKRKVNAGRDWDISNVRIPLRRHTNKYTLTHTRDI